MHPLVSSSWLSEHLNDPDLIILDSSPITNVNKKASENTGLCIPNARLFDLKNNFSDKSIDLPNMLPSPESFETECQKLGVNQNSKIVVYDNLGIYTSPRVWWMFKVMGHQNIMVLDGGLPDWMATGRPTTPINEEQYESGNFKANFEQERVKDYHFILANTKAHDNIVIDTRSSGRFSGTAQEPREGLRSGHIPNTLNLPFEDVLENGKYKSTEALTELFKAQPIDDNSIVYSCGSGLTACIVLLASEMVLPNKTLLYDGSWTEWAQLED